MPSQSTLGKEEKDKVKSAIPVASNKIFYATLARVYYAHPRPNEWSYSGMQGALAFAKNNTNGIMTFKLVDLTGTRGVIWEHEVYDGLDYFADRAFFHSFPGDECMIGFVFSEEAEAKNFWKKVIKRKDEKSAGKPAPEKKKKASKGAGSKIDKSLISGPKTGSFVHVAHMGYDADTGFTSKGVDPSWTAFLSSLEGQGIDKEVIAQEMDFIKDFVRQHPEPAKKAKPSKPPPPPSRKAAEPPAPPPPRNVEPPPAPP
ncbi:PH domain-like protein, partial [Cylindrobasidium torrendii FP15055 ss-10]